MIQAKLGCTLLELLRESLEQEYDEDDEITNCGEAVLCIIETRPDEVIRLAHDKLHAYPWRDVPTCWRRAYTDGSLWTAVRIIERNVRTKSVSKPLNKTDSKSKATDSEDDWIQGVVRLLDMAVIMTGAPRRTELIESVFTEIGNLLDTDKDVNEDDTSPLKRRKIFHVSEDSRNELQANPISFSDLSPISMTLKHPIPRLSAPSLGAFQTHIDTTRTPLILTDALLHWPALTTRPWSNPSYLLSRTLGGRRLVPVELGRSYTDAGWAQRIIPFRQFLSEYMTAAPTASSPPPGPPPEPKPTAYLAQHDLFAQIPSLRADIAVPDYCYTAPPPPPRTISHAPAALDAPLLNAWFGPAGTISPLHTDPYHNILAQVVGAKYVRLYAPEETERVYPRGQGADGVDMGNTSWVDVGDLVEGAGEEGRAEVGRRFPKVLGAEYVECVLEAGEELYIPAGWWHYVRSLSPSFSVSFWWN